MKVTFIIPCRNNIKYLKQSVNSIQEHYGNYHDIVILDDCSSDGTWDWVTENFKNTDNVKTYRNDSKERVGHTVLYDIGISMANTEIVTILHSDMIVTKNYVNNMLKHMKKGVVVSATRIEPPLHPPGPEKLVQNFGFEPEEFLLNRKSFDEYVFRNEELSNDKTTNGVFAPWMIYREDFISVGGHDKLFAPMELEDSDIFNRFVMAGYSLIQSRDSFVYHMTCRGSRFKDGIEIEAEIPLSDGTIWYKPKDSDEYLQLRNTKLREWWRKWHCNVLHDSLMMPIVPLVYNTHFVVNNCTEELLKILEPLCDKMFVDCPYDGYIQNEQNNTMYDLSNKIHSIDELSEDFHIKLAIDGNKLNKNNFNEVIMKLPFIVEESAEKIGNFSVDSFILEINLPNDFSSIIPIKPVFSNIF